MQRTILNELFDTLKRFVKILRLGCPFCLLSFSVFAHLGNITGKVIDFQTKQPIYGATISIANINKGTTSDEFGRFQFNNLYPAAYKVEISTIGYANQVATILVKEDQTTQLEILMKYSDILLDEVKISATNPQHQQLISSLDIKLRPFNNSQEVLRIIPGLFIGQHQGGGKAEQLFLRGFDLDHGTDIRLSVDDMPINMVSHAHGQGYADAHFIIPELIEGVDFKKGLYDTNKGNFATAGWANYRTRSVLDQNIFKIEIGQFNTYRMFGAVNLLDEKKKTKNQSVYLAGEYSYSDSYFENPQDFKRLNLVGKYHGHIAKSTTLTLTSSVFWSKWNASGQIPERAVKQGIIGWFGAIDPNEGGLTNRTNLNAEFLTLNKNNGILKNQIFYANYNFELYSDFTFFLNDPLNGDQIRQKEGRNLWGYNGSYLINTEFLNLPATTTFGINYRQDMTLNSELSHTTNRTETLERIQFGNINEANLAAYIDENLNLSSNLTAIVGIRLDYLHNEYTNHLSNDTRTKVNSAILSPKFSLYYTKSSQLQFYLTTGKGFHSNDTRVVTMQKGTEILPAAYGADLGVVWKPLPKLFINAAFWYLWLAQEFVYGGDDGMVQPSGKSVRKGIDISLRYQLSKQLFFDADANWAKPRAFGIAEGHNYLPLAPIFTTMGGLSLQGKKGFNGSLKYRYVSNRPANEDNSLVAKGYFITDAQINYSHSKNYTIGLSIQNLFNSYWNETQFATESRLKNEATSTTEINFTPGTPFFAKLALTYFFK